MLDIKFIKENKDLVKENMKKKFQEDKIHLVDEAISIYDEYVVVKSRCDEIRAFINKNSKNMAILIKEDAEEAENIKKEVSKKKDELMLLQEGEKKLLNNMREKQMLIPNIIDCTVPIGRDDSENVEIEKFLIPKELDYECQCCGNKWKDKFYGFNQTDFFGIGS